jgi:hypothetical protein
MTIAFLRKECLISQEGFFGASLGAAGVEEVEVAAGSATRGALPMILKNAAVTLFQKTSRTPTMLAMPEVTVITWSGPAYSASKPKCMWTQLLPILKGLLTNFTGVPAGTEIKISGFEPAITLNYRRQCYLTVIKRVPV